MELISFNGKNYPKFQSSGFAARFVFPFAKEFCKGYGYDIGCAKKEWAFPGALPIDKVFQDGFDALVLPAPGVDYIFSSHCLEHVDNWVTTLNYWISCLKDGGILFLYLPHFNQEYWRGWNNRKHIHCLDKDVIVEYLKSARMRNIFTGDRDLNDSFVVVAEK